MLCMCCGGQNCTRGQGSVCSSFSLETLHTAVWAIFSRAYAAYHLRTRVGRQDGSETTPVHQLSISDRIESREGSLECKGSLGYS